MVDHPRDASKDGGAASGPGPTIGRRGKVFGIGLGRTGTTTLGEGLRLLGFRHLGWAGGDGGLRRDLGLLAMIDDAAFFEILDGFDSADDFPIPLLYRQLATRYPTARFVLTSRSSPERWVDSIISEFNRKTLNEGENTWYEGDLYAPDRRSRLERRYEAHQAAVREFFEGSPRLLEVCWERGDGWAELCRFLGEPVPQEPFPHVNKSRPEPPSDLVRRLIAENRHSKLSLILQERTDESLVREAREILSARVNGKLAVPGNPSIAGGTRTARPPTLDRAAPGPCDLAVCAIFRDEAAYLDEWLTFHHGVGARRFVLYNDRSTDDYRAVLSSWIERGIVTLYDWPEQNQVAAFNDCLRRHRDDATWIAFLDLDEFLFSPTGESVPAILRSHDDAAAVFVYWSLFGSGGHELAPRGPVVEAYRRCQSVTSAIHDTFDHGTPGTSDHITAWSRDGKSIVRAAWVEAMSAHQPKSVSRGRVVDENGQEMPRSASERRSCRQPFTQSLLRINHYWSKSIEELTRRSQRGCIFDRSRPHKRLERLLERERYLNERLDESIQPIWARIRRGARVDTGTERAPLCQHLVPESLHEPGVDRSIDDADRVG